MPVERESLQASLAHVRSVHTAETPIEQVLEETLTAVSALFECTGAGLLMVDQDGVLRSVAGSDETNLALEQLQSEAGEGPCVEALVTDATIVCADTRTDERYPTVGPRLADRSVGAVLGVPVRVAGAPVATLDAHADQPHDWGREEIDAIRAYSGLLGQLLASSVTARRHGQLAEQLQYALDYRVVIERAIGYLMSRHGISNVDAFSRLRAAARNRQRRVTEVAVDVLAGRLEL